MGWICEPENKFKARSEIVVRLCKLDVWTSMFNEIIAWGF
jgi:hypothetical protein